MNHIGKIIKSLRQKAKLSLCELSHLSGISKSYLSTLETGKQNNPSILVLEKLAPFLHVTLQDLTNKNFDFKNVFQEEVMPSNQITQLQQEVEMLRKEVSKLKDLIHPSKITEELSNVNIVSFSNEKFEAEISNFLLELRIAPNLKGFYFLREAITLVYHDFELIDAMTKELYPIIAKKFNTTPSRAERAMRHAIETSWYHIKKDDFYTRYFLEKKPTNTEFISLVADRFRRQYRSTDQAV